MFIIILKSLLLEEPTLRNTSYINKFVTNVITIKLYFVYNRIRKKKENNDCCSNVVSCDTMLLQLIIFCQSSTKIAKKGLQP